MHDPIAPFLHEFGILILDGGLASELENRGADLRDPLWSARMLLDAPHMIRQVHHDYFTAGADVATTASYQATFAGFAERGLNAERTADLMRLSVRLAQQARDEFWSVPAQRSGRRRPLVAASIGSYGAFLHDGSEYRGDYGLSAQQLMDFHRPRLAVLAESGADLLACETIPCRVEAEALIHVLAEFPSAPAWLSFSCRDAVRVCHGETFAECAALTDDALQVVAVGVNCTAPQHIAGLLQSLPARCAGGDPVRKRKPILVYPNSGESWDGARHAWSDAPTNCDWGESARAWHRLGASGVGGCCRTTPATIRQIKQSVRCM